MERLAYMVAILYRFCPDDEVLIKISIVYDQVHLAYVPYLGLSEECSTERDVIKWSSDAAAETDLYL